MISRGDVLYAGPDYYISPNETVPDDLIVKTQWAIESIKLSKAWDFSSGSSQVLVGIIDTGIDGTHPDLNASIRVDLSRDFSNGEEEELDYVYDFWGRGTKVAGVVGAIGNNNTGIVGTCWNVGLVFLRVYNDNDHGLTSYVGKAIMYAQKAGIKILNYSSSWPEDVDNNDCILSFFIDNYDGLFICGAGNRGADNNGEEGWIPGKYIIDNQITVGPLRINDNISNNSNYGKNTVAIYAPGSNILTISVDGYEHVSGTSLSAPYVTGVAALLLSLNEDLTAAQLKTAILEGADDIVIDVPDTSPGATETDIVEQDVLKLNAFVLLNMF